MQIGRIYIFRDNPHGVNTGDWGQKFILLSKGHKNVHYQVLGRKNVKALPIFMWDDYVLGPAQVPVQADSKLVFKFIN
jgi:hypothetical protein